MNSWMSSTMEPSWLMCVTFLPQETPFLSWEKSLALCLLPGFIPESVSRVNRRFSLGRLISPPVRRARSAAFTGLSRS